MIRSPATTRHPRRAATAAAILAALAVAACSEGGAKARVYAGMATISIAEAGPLSTSEDGSSATFTISIARAPSGDLAIPVRVGDESEGLLTGGSSPLDPQALVTVTFTAADWETPQTVTVVGQPDLDPDGVQTYAVTVGPASGDPDYEALAPLTIDVANDDVFVVTEPMIDAAYDGTLGAPACATVGGGCDSGPWLDSFGTRLDEIGIPHPEPHDALNTLTSSFCPDGDLGDAGGTYHRHPSLDALAVYTQDGSALAPGKTVVIEATVWVWYPWNDYLDLYYAADANAPAWYPVETLEIAALAPSQTGLLVLTTTYTLPSGTLQAIRGNYRIGDLGTASPCTAGDSNDHDDLVFAVSP